MRKNRFLLIFSALLFAGIFHAAPRTAEQALAIARRTVARRAPSNHEPNIPACEIIRRSDKWYAINAGSSFVVVSADDTMPEVLGFSPNGALDETNMPPALKAWLKDYDTNPLYIRTTEDECAPLITCHWNQYAPYNNMTPTYDSTNHCVTGCTATAMAQLMYTHRYPARGTGSHSYDWTCAENPAYSCTLSADFGSTVYQWDRMKDNYDVPSQYTAEQAEAVAELFFHCGVAIEMKYGSGGSSGSDVDVLQGLMNYFGYDHNILVLHKTMYEPEDFAEQMRNELRASRPVYMSGRGSGGGHAFLCDGFTSNGYFHINWGWGGLGDGDYLLTGLNPSQQGAGGNSSHDYNSDLTIAIGIRPATGVTDTVYQMSVGQIELPRTSAARSAAVAVNLLTVKNEGLHNFRGQYNVALLGENTDEIQAVLSNPYGSSLPANHFYTTPLGFSCSFPGSIPDGTYRLCGVFRSSSSSEWQVMREAGGKHLTVVTLTSSRIDIQIPEMESPVVMATDSIACNKTLVPRNGNWNATAWRVMNVGQETFTGQLGVVLLDPSTAEVVSVLAVHSSPINLPMNYYITTPVTVSDIVVPADVLPGSYLLAFAHHHVYSRWKPLQLAQNSPGKAVLPVRVSDTQVEISEITSDIDGVANDNGLWLDPQTTVYTLSGLRLNASAPLPSGVYILSRNGVCRKVFIP